MRLSIAAPDGALSANFSSTVRRVDERGLLIDLPHRAEEDLLLHAGDEVSLFVQVHGRMFQLETRVIAADFQVLLEGPREAEQTERRQFYRLLTSIDPLLVELLPVEEPRTVPEQVSESGESEEQQKPPVLEAIIVDLSGGGVRLRMSQELAVGQRLRLTFEPDGEPMTVVAEVVRTVPAEPRRRAVVQCRFEDISRRDQERIIRFIFEKQREYSQRGVA
jgi:c-di-GMP-binding flagellar brake protein YcgR